MNKYIRPKMPNRLMADDRQLAMDSWNFLKKELELIDEKIYEPLAGTDWPRDVPVKSGGGLRESIASIDVAYASTGGNEDGLIGDETNDIPVIQADLSKSVARCITWGEVMSFSILEREKMDEVGRDPQTFLDKGIRLHCDKTIDRSCYVGFTRIGTAGLINSSLVTRAMVPAGAASTTTWATKTADEILHDINLGLTAVWFENDCASDGLPNHILLPVSQFGELTTRKVDDGSGISILEYILKNNIVTQQGQQLVISPLKWCSGRGTNGSDRMVIYCNREDRLCFNLTQPLRRMDEEISLLRIKVPYIAQFSEVRFLYPTTVRYMDGI